MNPIPNILDGNRRDIDFDRTVEGDESTLKENPEGGTKSIKPKKTKNIRYEILFKYIPIPLDSSQREEYDRGLVIKCRFLYSRNDPSSQGNESIKICWGVSAQFQNLGKIMFLNLLKYSIN